MGRMFLVGLGGFIGTVARYGLGGLIARTKGSATFPYETLVINVLGCLAIGLLAGWADTRGVLSGTARAVLFIGVLGGFTTFSSFGYETIELLRSNQPIAAAWSVGLQLALGLGFVWAGGAVARWLGGAR